MSNPESSFRQEELAVPKEGTLLRKNNAFVLEAHRSEKNGNIYMLLFLPNNTQHFATAILTEPNGGWMHGHYFDNINEALSDFMERT